MKKYVIVFVVLMIILAGYLGVNALFSAKIEIPTTPVTIITHPAI